LVFKLDSKSQKKFLKNKFHRVGRGNPRIYEDSILSPYIPEKKGASMHLVLS
jgi:hypothetical protein